MHAGPAFGGEVAGSGRGFGWRICSQRPFGVPDLEYREGWVVIGTPELAGGLCWRQLEGDGMRLTSWEVGGGWSGARFHIGAGLDLRGLTAPARRTRLAGIPVGRLSGRLPGGWQAALMIRGGRSGRGWTDRGGEWSVACRMAQGLVGLGGTFSRSGRPTPVLFARQSFGRLETGFGLWGEPPSPGMLLGLRTGALEWILEVRWVPGAGTSVLWSAGSSRTESP
jgi:hypothetical protein